MCQKKSQSTFWKKKRERGFLWGHSYRNVQGAWESSFGLELMDYPGSLRMCLVCWVFDIDLDPVGHLFSLCCVKLYLLLWQMWQQKTMKHPALPTWGLRKVCELKSHIVRLNELIVGQQLCYKSPIYPYHWHWKLFSRHCETQSNPLLLQPVRQLPQFPPLAERKIAFRSTARSQQDCLSMYRFNCGNASFPAWPDRPRHLHRNMRLWFDSPCSRSFLLLLPLVYFPILYFFQLWPAQMSMADRRKKMETH